MSRLVRTLIYIAVIALVLVVVAPKVFADDDSWYFDMDSGTQYDFSTHECWLADGTAGTPQWTEDNLWCETPNDIQLAEWTEESGTPPLEEGATFDGGICWEADGTEGISSLDGSCTTPADYDEIFSYENLSEIPSFYDPEVSIAEAYDVQPEGDASDRPIGEGLVEPGTEKSFKEHVKMAHAPHMPIAD